MIDFGKIGSPQPVSQQLRSRFRHAWRCQLRESWGPPSSPAHSGAGSRSSCPIAQAEGAQDPKRQVCLLPRSFSPIFSKSILVIQFKKSLHTDSTIITVRDNRYNLKFVKGCIIMFAIKSLAVLHQIITSQLNLIWYQLPNMLTI